MCLLENMKIYLVGGAVRDQLLGLKTIDRDWLVLGATEEKMLSQGYLKVGKHFPVFLHPQTKEEYALARTEKKVTKGYHGFAFNATTDISLIDDLKRRDLSINAMAIDEHDNLYDPFNGQQAIKDKQLRHVSEAFSEDPLRVLRVARFAAMLHHLGFHIANETLKLMQHICQKNELETLSGERIYQELHRALSTQNPEVFFQTLKKVHAFNHILPTLQTLDLSRLKKILNTIPTQNKQPQTLFAILLYVLADESTAMKLSHEICIPKLTTRLGTDLIKQQAFLSDIISHKPKDILIHLKQINALRDSEYLNTLLTIAHYIDNSHTTKHAYQLVQNLVHKLKNYDYKVLIDKKGKKTIAHLVEQAQLQIIAKMIHQ